MAVAVAISTLFGFGAALALTPSVPPRLGELLFGDLLGVTEGDLVRTGALAGLVVVALAAAHRPLTLSAFDPGSAPSLGVRPGATAGLALALLAVTTVAGVGALGNLLIVALILAPAAAALNLVDSLGAAMGVAAGLAAASGLAGLYASWYLDVAAGASVALCAVAAFALSLLRGGRDGSRGVGRLPIDALGGAR